MAAEEGKRFVDFNLQNQDGKRTDRLRFSLGAEAWTETPATREWCYSARYKPAFAKIGITGVGWHTFRHTVGSILAEMGEHQLTSRDFLRHSHLNVTNQHLQATSNTTSGWRRTNWYMRSPRLIVIEKQVPSDPIVPLGIAFSHSAQHCSVAAMRR